MSQDKGEPQVKDWHNTGKRGNPLTFGLHPLMLTKDGYLLPKLDGVIIRFDKDYVLRKIGLPIFQLELQTKQEWMDLAAEAWELNNVIFNQE